MTERALSRASARLRESPPAGFPGKPGRPRKPGAVVVSSTVLSTNGHSLTSGQGVTPQPETAVPSDVPAKRARVPLYERRGLAIKDAAVYAGVSTWTLRALIESGTLKRIRIPVEPGGTELRRVLIDRVALDALIDRWQQ